SPPGRACCRPHRGSGTQPERRGRYPWDLSTSRRASHGRWRSPVPICRKAPPYEAEGRIDAEDEDGRPAEGAGGPCCQCRGKRIGKFPEEVEEEHRTLFQPRLRAKGYRSTRSWYKQRSVPQDDQFD